MTLTRLAAKCQACPKVDICNHKRMEAMTALELPGAQIMGSNSLGTNEIEVRPSQVIDLDAATEELARTLKIPESILKMNYICQEVKY